MSVATDIILETAMSAKRVADDATVSPSKKSKAEAFTFDPTFGTKSAEAPKAEAKLDKDEDEVSGDEVSGGEEGETIDVDQIFTELVEMFKKENGREPTEEEMNQWKEQILSANLELNQSACEDEDEEEDEEEEEDEGKDEGR
jgi:hypothetical protein